MSGYFPEPKSLGGRESNLENATGVDTSKFAKKSWFSIFKSNEDKLDIGKF